MGEFLIVKASEESVIPQTSPIASTQIEDVASVLDHDDFGLNQSKIINVIDHLELERVAGGKPLRTFPQPASDHDDFGLKQSKIINVIDSKKLERVAGGKPLRTFTKPALDAAAFRQKGVHRCLWLVGRVFPSQRLGVRD